LIEKQKIKRRWDKNRHILKSIANPSKDAYEIKMKIPELTFEGVRGQPDFGVLYITMYPSKKVVELKSLKEYFFAFRSQIFSYERIINVIYDDMLHVYEPTRLRLVLVCNPRGGKDSFKDWVGQKDEW
jgi:7-cyano-7-deazaguanine reductase